VEVGEGSPEAEALEAAEVALAALEAAVLAVAAPAEAGRRKKGRKEKRRRSHSIVIHCNSVVTINYGQLCTPGRYRRCKVIKRKANNPR
jgi:hypothetical protein